MGFDQTIQVRHKIDAPVLIVGHTGFKGTWLTLLLEKLGIDAIGLSLPAEENSLYSKLNRHGQISEFFQDIRDYSGTEKIIKRINPRFIIHLAAQPLVLNSYLSPRETFETNVLGTVNILEAATRLDNCEHVIVATTDKVYRNDDSGEQFTENSALGGKDPYSWSKVGTEAAIGAWQQIMSVNSGTKITSVRAGNVIGGGDIAKNRLLPDLIKSFLSNSEILLRNPKSTRPWQHALDPLWGYVLALAAESKEPAFNFSPDGKSLTVLEVANIAVDAWNSSVKINIEIEQSKLESNALELSSILAQEEIKWKNSWSQENAIISTVNWWKSIHDNKASPIEACKVNLDELFAKVSNE
jgi:CDP-glucose 4,6-dehydratase